MLTCTDVRHRFYRKMKNKSSLQVSISSKSRSHLSLIWVWVNKALWVQFLMYNFSSTAPLHLQICETKESRFFISAQPTYSNGAGIRYLHILFSTKQKIQSVWESLVHSNSEVQLGKCSLTRFSGLGLLHGCWFYPLDYWYHSLSHPSFFMKDSMCLKPSFLSLLPASRILGTFDLFPFCTVPDPFCPISDLFPFCTVSVQTGSFC